MEDKEIIKALECCSNENGKDDCMNCPNFKDFIDCKEDLYACSLDLINRLKEANKHHEKAESFAEKAFKLHEEETKLKDKEIEILIRKKEALKDEIAEKDAEIERLKENQKSLISHIICGKEIMKEALVDFCEKAKEATFHYYDSEIDSVYKELTESNE